MKQAIQDILAQRPPFLLVDKILELKQDAFIVTLKNVSINEPFLRSNETIPNFMPNSLILESMIQSASALILSNPKNKGHNPMLQSVDKAHFYREAVPADQLRIEVEIVQKKEEALGCLGKVFIDGQTVAEASFSIHISTPLSRPKVHPTASVHPTAILDKDVVIGPYSVIGERVFIGRNTIIEPHVYVEKYTKIGENNHIHFGCVIGANAQDIKYKGEESWVEIGDYNIFREYVTINRATGAHNVTRIGNNNMLLTNVHVGHNCSIHNHVTIANAVHLGGHVDIDDGATIGGMTGIHQFVRIGKKTMTGGYARLIQDVPPFMLCDGNPAYVRGLNAVGLRRSKVPKTAFSGLKEAYRLLYRSENNLSQALEKLAALDASEQLNELRDFLSQDTSRGISKKSELDES